MASPPSKLLTITPHVSRVLDASTSVVLRNGDSSINDEAIWKRLREAGFDEETIKWRDKATLISYITKLETEIHDYQHHMGLLLLEKKEWTSNYEQFKVSADSAQTMHKHDQAAHLSALAEARKREESLKKALGIEKECIVNMEKTLHDMRAESAEIKLASESKLAEARVMVENAQTKLTEAETKLHAAEALKAEASRCHSAAERKLKEIEAREDDLRRRLVSFKSEYDDKEKEISLERQCLYERQKILEQGQEKLLKGQSLLNQREEYIFERTQEFSRLEKECDATNVKIEKAEVALKEERSNLLVNMAALTTREEAVIKREAQIVKKEKDLHIQQEKLARKEQDEIQVIKAEHKAALEKRTSEFEAELELKRKLMEDEIEMKRQACEDREVDLNHREEHIRDKENDLELQLNAFVKKEEEAAKKLKLLVEKEQHLCAAEKTVEMGKMRMQKIREEIHNKKLDLQEGENSLKEERKKLFEAQEKLELTKNERNDLLILEMRLKEEIDSLRVQKSEIMVEAQELKAEKEKFENEWELVDEKREELRKDAEHIEEERKAVCKFLKEEHDNLRKENDALHDQFKHNRESLAREREAFLVTTESERSEWLSKIHKEREDFAKDIEVQKRELENRVEKRREEIESYLREREEAFEQEKAIELQYIYSQKEMVAKELEHIALEITRLDKERKEIALDREIREKEWTEIKNSIEELQIQRERLQQQRESLHADREEIYIQIQRLKKLEDLEIASENRSLLQVQQPGLDSNKGDVPAAKCLNALDTLQDNEQHSDDVKEAYDKTGSRLLPKQTSDSSSPPVSAPLTWVRKYTDMIFKHSPERDVTMSSEKNFDIKFPIKHGERSVVSQNLNLRENRLSRKKRSTEIFSRSQSIKPVVDESKDKGVPSRGEYGVIAHSVEPEIDANRKNTDLYEDSPVQNRNGKKSRSIDSGANALLARGKRSKNSSSHVHVDDVEGQLELSQNLKKRRRLRDGTEMLLEETTTKCVVSMEASLPENEDGLIPFDQALGDIKQIDSVTDDHHEIPEVIVAKVHTGIPSEQAKLSSSQRHDNLQDEGLHGNNENVFPPVSYCQGSLNAQKKSHSERTEETGQKTHNDNGCGESKQDNEEVDEDEEQATAKKKLWNFLIT